MVMSLSIAPHLYTDEFGLLSLFDLVVNSDVSLTPFGMNDRPDATVFPLLPQFPQICGRGESGGEATYRVPFVLTPLP